MEETPTPESTTTTDVEVEEPPKQKPPPNKPRPKSDSVQSQQSPKKPRQKSESVQSARGSAPKTHAEEPPPKRKSPPKPLEQKPPKSSKVEDAWHWKPRPSEPPPPPIEHPAEHHHRKSKPSSAGHHRHSKGSTSSSDAESEGEEKPKPPPPPPPPPAPPPEVAIPLGPDLKPRKLSADGTPVPQKTPKDWKGQPLKPPPIIAQDGKEIPRPLDPQGKPMPIYVTEDGKPILDKQGNAIPLKFDEQGRPKPLEMKGPPNSYQVGQQEIVQQPSAVPMWLSMGGIANALICIGIAGFVGYVYHEIEDLRSRTGLIIGVEQAKTALGSALGLILAEGLVGLANYASTTNAIIVIWITFSTVLFIAQGCILYFMDAMRSDPNVVCVVYSGLVFLFVLIGSCGRYFCPEDNSPPSGSLAADDMTRMYNQQPPLQQQTQNPSNYVDPRSIQEYVNQQAQVTQRQQQQVQVQQAPVMTTTVYQPMVVVPTTTLGYPSYGYGYGFRYPSYGAYGMGMGLGLGMGMGLGYSYSPYYDYGWYDPFW